MTRAQCVALLLVAGPIASQSAPSGAMIGAEIRRMSDADPAVRSAARAELARWLDSPSVWWVAQQIATHGAAAVPLLDLLGERAFASSDAQARQSLLWALTMIGRSSPASLPWLVRLLREGPDVNSRTMALNTIQALGTNAAQAVPDVVALLASPDEWLRQCALGALGVLGGEAAVAAITARLSASGQGERHAALRALARQGAAATASVPDVLKLLLHQDVATATLAIETLVKIASRPDALADALARALLHTHEDVRLAAVHGIAELGVTTPVITGRLGDLLRDESPRVAEASTLAFVVLGGAGARSVLEAAAGHVDPEVRARAAQGLAALANDRARTQALVAAFSHTGEPVPLAALGALARHGAACPSERDLVLAALARQADNYLFPIRTKALALLASFWPHANESVCRVFAAHLAGGRVFEDALLAQGETIVPALRAQCGIPGPLRSFAVRMLERLGGRAAAALPELQALQGDADTALAGLARTAIAAITRPATTMPASAPALDRLTVPELVRALEGHDRDARAAALAALAGISRDVAAAVPPALKYLADEDDEVQAEALRFLRWRGGPHRDAILAWWSSCPPRAWQVAGLLARSFTDGQPVPASLARAAATARHPFVRETALLLLGRVPGEVDRLALCRAGLRDPVASVRRAAAQAADAAGAAVVMDLVALLGDQTDVVLAAFPAAHRFGPSGRPLALAALDGPDSRLQYQGAYLLTTPGVARTEDRERLCGLLTHADTTIRARAAAAVGDLSNTSEHEGIQLTLRLRPLLFDPSVHVIAGAARGLTGLGARARSAAPDVLSALANARRQERRSSETEAVLLGAFAASATAPVALAEAARVLGAAEQAPLVRAAAARMIARCGSGERGLLPLLRTELRAERRTVAECVAALQALGAVAADADPATATAAVDAILGRFSDVVLLEPPEITASDSAFRCTLGASLAQIGPACLSELARQSSEEGRRLLALAVAGIAGRDVPTLVRLLDGENKLVRNATVAGIVELTHTGRQVSAPEASAQQLASRLSNLVGQVPDAGLALAALGETGMHAIGRILAAHGRAAATVLRELQGRTGEDPRLVPLLVRHWHDPQARRPELVAALAACGAEGIRAIERLDVSVELAWEALVCAAQRESVTTSNAALRALSRYDPRPERASDLLAVVIWTRDPRTLEECLPLLRRVSLAGLPAVPHLVPLLIAGLASDLAAARKESARALGVTGPAGLAALPYLREAMADDDADVRAAAATALESLRVPAAGSGR